MPIHYWPYAFLTATYLINCLPTATLNHSSPYRKLFGSDPNYTFLHNFGSRCYPWLRPYSSHKLDPRSIACVFVGYSPTQHVYLCLDPTTNRTYSSRHVRFLDSVYPFRPSSGSNATPPLPTSSQWCDFTIPMLTPPDPTPTSPLTSSTPSSSTSPSVTTSTSYLLNSVPTFSQSASPTPSPIPHSLFITIISLFLFSCTLMIPSSLVLNSPPSQLSLRLYLPAFPSKILGSSPTSSMLNSNRVPLVSSSTNINTLSTS